MLPQFPRRLLKVLQRQEALEALEEEDSVQQILLDLPDLRAPSPDLPDPRVLEDSKASRVLRAFKEMSVR